MTGGMLTDIVVIYIIACCYILLPEIGFRELQDIRYG